MCQEGHWHDEQPALMPEGRGWWISNCRSWTLSSLWHQRVFVDETERSLVGAWLVCLYSWLPWDECWTFSTYWIEKSIKHKASGAGQKFAQNIWSWVQSEVWPLQKIVHEYQIDQTYRYPEASEWRRKKSG